MITDRLPLYLRIYSQIYDTPFMPINKLADKTGIPRSSLSRYLQEMYEKSIVQGPFIFLKPASHYCLHASFLKFTEPQTKYKQFEKFPHILSRTLNAGSWNILLISEKLYNFSGMVGFKECILQDVKGVTYLSKVTCLDWKTSLERIENLIAQPKQKSFLYEEPISFSWGKEEKLLYDMFKHNARKKVISVLQESKISYERLQKWFKDLPKYTSIFPVFFPLGIENYFFIDFLLKTEYPKQLIRIFSLLPSTTLFYSVGNEHLFTRLSITNKQEMRYLFSVIHKLDENSFLTDLHTSFVISTDKK